VTRRSAFLIAHAVSLTAALVFILLILALEPGCASPVTRPTRLPTCLPDPENNALYCDGEIVLWKDTKGRFVCHAIDQWATYLESCK